MRYIWLALTIVIPVAFAQLSEISSGKMSEIYDYVGIFSFIVALGLTVSEFIKQRNIERREEIRQILRERDADIIKWRREFYAESADLYDAQKTILTKAHELGDHHLNYKRSFERRVDRPFRKDPESV